MDTKDVFLLSLPATRAKDVRTGEADINMYSYLYHHCTVLQTTPADFYYPKHCSVKIADTIFFLNAVMAKILINYSECYF